MFPTTSRNWISLALLAVAAIAIPTSARAQWKTHWEYAGPKGASHWGPLIFASKSDGRICR